VRSVDCGLRNTESLTRRCIPHSALRIPHLIAALVQLQETLRSERRGWGWKSLTRHHLERGVRIAECGMKSGTIGECCLFRTPHSPFPIYKAHVVQCRDGALKTRRVQGLPRGPFSGMPTGQANRASVLTSACLWACGASPRHSASLCRQPPLRA
jgi:hypothetical protein